MIADADAYGRFPISRSGSPARAASSFHVSSASPATTRKRGSPNRDSRNPIALRSISNAVTAAMPGIASSISVIAPRPGPISQTVMPAPASSSETSFARAPRLMRKFWPHRFLSVIPSAASVARISAGESWLSPAPLTFPPRG